MKLDPETQIVATLGSKEGFANMAQAITAPGDVVLTPNPSYPIHAFGFLIAGGVIRSVPAEPSPEYFVALERALIHSTPKPIAVVVCYPSNPTAMVASLDFYKDLVLFAKKHEIFILSDLAYAEVYFDESDRPPSVLQAPGAFDVAVEFTSMSKTFSMAGWRMGFAVGNERLIAALGRVKSYLDYGAFTPIQVAAAAALNGPEDCIKEMRATYKRRRDVMVESFAAAGWPIEPPRASMFAWTPVPEKFRHLGSLEFSKLLIEKADVAVSPGIGFGEHGDDYVRLALVENEQRIRQAARGVKRFFEFGRPDAAQRRAVEETGVRGGFLGRFRLAGRTSEVARSPREESSCRAPSTISSSPPMTCPSRRRSTAASASRSAPNRHPWGTENHIVQFDGAFLELIGLGDAFAAPHPGEAGLSLRRFPRRPPRQTRGAGDDGPAFRRR